IHYFEGASCAAGSRGQELRPVVWPPGGEKPDHRHRRLLRVRRYNTEVLNRERRALGRTLRNVGGRRLVCGVSRQSKCSEPRGLLPHGLLLRVVFSPGLLAVARLQFLFLKLCFGPRTGRAPLEGDLLESPAQTELLSTSLNTRHRTCAW